MLITPGQDREDRNSIDREEQFIQQLPIGAKSHDIGGGNVERKLRTRRRSISSKGCICA